jgi:hypothetical protein
MRSRWWVVALPLVIGCGGNEGSGARVDADTGVDALFPDAGDVGDTVVPQPDGGEGDVGDVGDVVGPSEVLDAVDVPDTSNAGDAGDLDGAADTEVASPDVDAIAEVVDTMPDTVGPTCIELAAAHTRHVVVSRPYSAAGTSSTLWQVYPLQGDATLGASRGTFDMGAAGRAFSGKVAFREDGAIGVTVHDRGEVGVFALDGDGKVTVLMAATDLGPYVDEVVVRGDEVYLVDSNWPNNGGGIYRANLGCDGTIGEVEFLYPTKLAAGLRFIDGMGAGGVEHLVAAREAVTTDLGHVHRVAYSDGAWRRVGGVDLFGDDEAIMSSLAVTEDGRYALVGDNSAFSGVPNRVGVAALSPMGAKVALSPFDDPFDLVVSPYNDAVLVVLGFANRVNVVRYDADAATPFVNAGSPTYATQFPQLPADAMRVGGDHEDVVFVIENTAIRRFRFNGNGTVTDLGRVITGEGYLSIPGALGIQP